MDEFMDPFSWYLFLILLLVGGGLGLGVYAAEHLDTAAAFVLVGLLGFVAGQYAVSSWTEGVGFGVALLGAVGIVAAALMVSPVLPAAVFLLGYLLGHGVTRR